MPAVTRSLRKVGSSAPSYRKAHGEWMQDLRLKAGLTQAELAQKVGLDWATAISGIETGQRSIPPDRLLAFADAFGMDPRIFTARVLKFTHPHAAALLLGSDPRTAFAKVMKQVAAG